VTAEGSLAVVVVEDQPLFRELLTGLLDASPGFRVLWAAGGAREARERFRAGEADVALLDIELPDGNGFALGTRLRAEDPRLGIVLLSGHDMMELLLGVDPAERRGWSYLSKTGSSTAEILHRALRASSDGESMLDPALVARMVPRVNSPLERLSPREFRALQLVSQGMSNASIAEEMAISAHSVDNLLNRSYAVLGLKNDPRLNRRVAAAAMMIEHSARPVVRSAPPPVSS
jgi:DNA-binding NarL/FixJ family response regulator